MDHLEERGLVSINQKQACLGNCLVWALRNRLLGYEGDVLRLLQLLSTTSSPVSTSIGPTIMAIIVCCFVLVFNVL